MFGLLLVFVGIGAACVLLYNVAVYALPFAIGVWVGFGVLHWGGGPILGIVIGLVAGGMAYGVGEQIFEHSHSLWLRLVTAIVFVAPAVYVGYSGTLQLSALAMSSNFWEHVLAVIAAISVGSTAFTRLVTPRHIPARARAIYENSTASQRHHGLKIGQMIGQRGSHEQ